VRFGKRRDDDGPADDGRDAFLGLRAQVLGLDPSLIGADPAASVVWGALMEMGIETAVATIVALADGSTSLYTSTGGGVIGGGEHASVVAENRGFLAAIERNLERFVPDDADELPTDGTVTFRALTHRGKLSATAAEAELGAGTHPLSEVFFAGHRVITALRLIASPP